jgi:hypothetical protein
MALLENQVALIADEVGYGCSFPVRELFIPSMGTFRELTASVERGVFSKPTRILLVNDHQEQKKFPLMRIFVTINSSNC